MATHGSDEEYTPSTRFLILYSLPLNLVCDCFCHLLARRRQVQQSIKDHFPVRRSARRCKAVLEVVTVAPFPFPAMGAESHSESGAETNMFTNSAISKLHAIPSM